MRTRIHFKIIFLNPITAVTYMKYVCIWESVKQIEIANAPLSIF